MAEKFVDLQRRFVTVKLDEAIDAEDWSAFGFSLHNGFGWSDLLERSRVVVLAEASAGKSEEFRARAAALAGESEYAVFLTIEGIHANGLDGSLGVAAARALEAWRIGDRSGWFFLDSVDEARLNDKDVESRSIASGAS